MRVDDIRVFYDVTDTAVEVLAIVPKSRAGTWLERFGMPPQEPGGSGQEGENE